MHQIDHDYVASLELELAKMLVFRNELPLSIELVSRATESCRHKLSSASIDFGVGGLHQQPNLRESSSEETASDCERVLQLIPMKKTVYESSSEKQHDLPKMAETFGDRSDWLRSVQLWNQTTDLPNESEELPEKQLVDDVAAKSKFTQKLSPESCSTETKKSEVDKEGSSQRKKRRCWSQDLHRRFLHSLQQLGGAPVATPKRIMELMKVDGLTRDEVKSHLQKYRLHARRPTPPPSQYNGSNSQPPRFLNLGAGLWAPPVNYTATMTVAPTAAITSRHQNGDQLRVLQSWHDQLNQKATKQVQKLPRPR